MRRGSAGKYVYHACRTHDERDRSRCARHTIRGDALAVEVMKTVEQRRINSVIAVDADDRVIGLVDVQDLPG